MNPRLFLAAAIAALVLAGCASFDSGHKTYHQAVYDNYVRNADGPAMSEAEFWQKRRYNGACNEVRCPSK
jgi:hypothetical protein